MKRCPNCGASNPETAQWCSLCLERFDEPAPEPEIPSEGDAAPVRTASKPDYSAFQVTEEGIKWICPTCSNANNLDAQACTACGTTFAEAVRPKAARPQRDPATAALVSLFFPGAGHAYLGMWGQAVARGVLSFWVLLVAVVGLLDKDVPGSLFMAVAFGLAAFGLWFAAAHDAYREANDETSMVLMRGKRFLYIVLGLLCLLFVVMFAALMSARGRTADDALGGPTSIPVWRSTSSRIFMEPPTT